MNDIMKIVNSLEGSGLLRKVVSETTKKKKSSLVTDTIRGNEGIVRAGPNFLRHLILLLILKYKIITKINLDLMVFIQKIIFLK